MFINGMYQAGVITINDLTRENGSFMSLGELKRILPTVRVDILTYERLIRGIPRMWKEKLATGSYYKITDDTRQCSAFLVGQKNLTIAEIRSKHFYTARVGQETSSAVSKWEQYGYNINDWKEVFQIPYICTQSTKLQTLQYSVLHRYISTRRYLFTSKRMHGMNQTEAASFIISDIIPKVNYLSSHVSTCRRPIL